MLEVTEQMQIDSSDNGLRRSQSSRNTVNLNSTLLMKLGGRLSGVHIAYEQFGCRNAEKTNTVLIVTGLSGDTHVCSSPEDPGRGWWESMVGPGRAIDTAVWHVICVNSLGSCKGSTGPASIDPETGYPYRLTFPTLTIEDIADATVSAVRLLGINSIRCLVGPSMGGMISLAILMRHPDFAFNHINISSGLAGMAFSVSIRSIQRELIRNDPSWKSGNYDHTDRPLQGLVMARKLGTLMYRSPAEWTARFGRERAPQQTRTDHQKFDFRIESYLQDRAIHFANTFDANCYLYLSLAIDMFDGRIASRDNLPPSGSLNSRLERALVIGVSTDILYPLMQQEEIAHELRAGLAANVSFVSLESGHGHDSFLVDADKFGPPVRTFMASLRSM